MDSSKKSKIVKGDFQKIVDHIKTVSGEVGVPVTSETDLTARCESLKYLNDLRSIAEGISRELSSLCEKEKQEIQFFIEQQEQRLASVKNALKGGNEHVPIATPGTPETSETSNTNPMFKAPEVLENATHSDSMEQKQDYLWAVVGKKGRAQQPQYKDITPPAQIESGHTIINQQVGKNGGFVRAVEVDAIDDCVRFPGKICWSKNKRVFCFSFDGVPRPLVSKIPRIYSVNETPRKFYDHKYLKKGETVNPDDHSFHIPIDNTEFADHWCGTDRARYLPGAMSPGKSDAFIYRIGDYDNFVDDLAYLREDSHEYILFRNMASAYWITLCAIENEFKRRRQTGVK